MIDIHIHILPAMDDGPETMDGSLSMARVAVQNDIRIAIATPHCLNGRFVNRRQEISEACRSLNEALRAERVPLTVLPGAEVRLAPEILGELSRGRLMTLADAGRHLCVELSEPFLPRAVLGFIRQLKGLRITPVLTHPEKSPYLQRNTRIAEDMVSAGAMLQIAGGSLTGEFGKAAQECAAGLVRSGCVHFMASDAHSALVRPPLLGPAVRSLRALAGEAAVRRIMVDNPVALLGGAGESFSA